MDANNIEILIPYQDIKTVKNTDMNSLIDQYDNQVFKLYDELTGIPTNTVRDQPVKGRYFAFADQDGIGAAYWSVNYTAANRQHRAKRGRFSPDQKAKLGGSWLSRTARTVDESSLQPRRHGRVQVLQH